MAALSSGCDLLQKTVYELLAAAPRSFEELHTCLQDDETRPVTECEAIESLLNAWGASACVVQCCNSNGVVCGDVTLLHCCEPGGLVSFIEAHPHVFRITDGQVHLVTDETGGLLDPVWPHAPA